MLVTNRVIHCHSDRIFGWKLMLTQSDWIRLIPTALMFLSLGAGGIIGGTQSGGTGGGPRGGGGSGGMAYGTNTSNRSGGPGGAGRVYVYEYF